MSWQTGPDKNQGLREKVKIFPCTPLFREDFDFDDSASVNFSIQEI
jgi:hypothetical protein